MSVAVIGAGASGLTAVKCCLDEGLEPTCYEKRDHIGGLWHYSPVVVKGESSVMDTTISNVSKEMMAFSDFPPPKDFPPYMPHKEANIYLEMYADAFGLRQHIKTSHEVVEIKESADHVDSGRWVIRVKNRHTNITEELTYDFVMVCSGIFGKPNIPDVEGLSTFKGRILHSHEYRYRGGFENQSVLVVGFGNSAGDSAVDVSNVAKQVYLSSRNGGWVLTRVSKKGLPFDLIISRFLSYIQKAAPKFVIGVVQKDLNKRIDHKLFRFNPKLNINQSAGFINDELPARVLHGAIKIKPNIKCFTENGVEFIDGSKHEIDSVIFATGYHVEFPFIADDVIGVDKAGFYKGIFPPKRKTSSLAVIGCVRVKGAVLPVAEMQARVATSVFKGRISLPYNEKMVAAVLDKKEHDLREKSPNLSFIQQVDFISYLDELAEMIDCKPKIGSLLVSDFKLAKQCLFGPCVPYQYRLFGPCPWGGAREAILTTMDRIYWPLNPNYKQELEKNGSSTSLKFLLALSVIFASLFIYYSDKSLVFS